jgi:hypothetical protein
VIVVTAICRRAFFRLSLLLVWFLALPAAAAVSLSLESIRHPAFEADNMQVAFDTGRKGEAHIDIGRLRVAGVEYKNLALVCEDFVLDIRRIDCPRGQIRRADTRGGERPALPFSFSYRFSDGRLELVVVGADAMAWSPLIKRLRTWRPEGTVDLRLTADRRQADLGIALHKLKFSNKEGDLAGAGIDVSLEATAQRVAGNWQWSAKAVWPEGELYVAPWYRRAAVRAEAAGTLTDETLRIASARLELGGIGSVTAGLRWDRAKGEVTDWAFVTDELDLATAFREWVQPWLDQSAVPTVHAAGRARFAASWSDGRWQSFYAGLEDARLTDGTDYLQFDGMNASVPWQRGVDSEAVFSVAGGRLGDLPLGDFRIPMRMRGNEASMEHLTIPLLDGRLYIDEFRAQSGDAGWRGRFSGGIEGVSMPKLSAALKLPQMVGSLTARIPQAEYGAGVLALGGDLVIEVFDGRIVATGLKVLDPLRPTQRVVADVAARNLDLGLLTRTFSFGSILGRFDADLRGLELQGWQPVRFDARIGSSPGDYRRAISRGALQDISSLGGTAGGAAVRASPAGLFNTFDYERIGFGCALRDNVCRFDGLEPADKGYVIIKGSGLPRVQVIGYNRDIDWNLLVSRIRAVIAGKSKAVIE